MLANLWEFPNCEIDTRKDTQLQLNSFLNENWGLDAQLQEHVLTFEHTFSHIKWILDVYYGVLHTDMIETEELKLATVTELDQYPFSVSHQKIKGRLPEWISN